MTSVCDWQDKDPQKRTHHQDADACRSSQFLKIALCAVVTCPLLTNPTFTASVSQFLRTHMCYSFRAQPRFAGSSAITRVLLSSDAGT
eukprot:m.29916 g.29916  ORF g.29916 m.29916 type:complete len:88 (+) comp13800_c0_seq4:1313-1576(+)